MTVPAPCMRTCLAYLRFTPISILVTFGHTCKPPSAFAFYTPTTNYYDLDYLILIASVIQSLYNLNMIRDLMPRNFLQLLQALCPNISFQLRTQLLGIYNNSLQQQLEYTCPGCWREVTAKPVVNYTLKEVVVSANQICKSSLRSLGSGSRWNPSTASSLGNQLCCIFLTFR